MPYVMRNAAGKITRATVKLIHGSEGVAYDNPEFITFLEENGQNPKTVDESLLELRRTDADMSRIIEDVVRALLKKNLLRMTDLPDAVQDKISYRIKMRVAIEESLEHASHTSQTNEMNASGLDNEY